MATVQKIYDEYSEKCLLATMLINSELIDMVTGSVEKEYFYNPVNRRIYEKICSLRNNNKPVNYITISEGERNDSDSTKMKIYLSELTSLVAGPSAQAP